MTNIVRLQPKPRPKRGEQVGSFRTSMAMFLMLADIEGMEGHGGAPVDGLNVRTYRALKVRGLVAEYTCYGLRACISPVGRNVLRGWRSRRRADS